MRMPIALVIYVSLTAAALFDCYAESPRTAVPDWESTHTAGLAAFERQSYEEAVAYLKQSWSLSRNPTQQGISANDLGQVFRQFGRADDARKWLERACDIWRAGAGEGHGLAVAVSSLGYLHRDAGDYLQAESLLREALGVRDPDPNSTAKIRYSLADLLREEGRDAEAAQLFLETLRQDDISTKQRLNALIGLADIDGQAEDREASVRKWNEVLEMARGQHDDLSEAIASRGLASVWLSAGELARAEPLLRRSLSIMESSPEATPVDLANALSSMAILYRARNKLMLAEAAWSQALAIERKAFGDMHPQVAWLMEMLADVYSARGDRDKARDYSTRALEAMKRVLGEDTLPTAAAFANRAAVEQRASDLEAAAKDYARALEIARAHPGHDQLEKTLLQRYAGLLKAMHRGQEAKELSAMARSFRPN